MGRPHLPPLSTQAGWGPRAGAGSGTSQRAALSLECWAFLFIPQCTGLGWRPRGSQSWRGDPSSAGEEQTAPWPSQGPHKAPSMSSCGQNVTCFIGERFVPRKGGSPNGKAPPATPTPEPPLSVPLQLLLSSLLTILLTLPLTVHSVPGLKWECFLPLGQDSLPQLCHHFGRLPGSRGP